MVGPKVSGYPRKIRSANLRSASIKSQTSQFKINLINRSVLLILHHGFAYGVVGQLNHVERDGKVLQDLLELDHGQHVVSLGVSESLSDFT